MVLPAAMATMPVRLETWTGAVSVGIGAVAELAVEVVSPAPDRAVVLEGERVVGARRDTATTFVIVETAAGDLCAVTVPSPSSPLELFPQA